MTISTTNKFRPRIVDPADQGGLHLKGRFFSNLPDSDIQQFYVDIPVALLSTVEVGPEFEVMIEAKEPDNGGMKLMIHADHPAHDLLKEIADIIYYHPLSPTSPQIVELLKAVGVDPFNYSIDDLTLALEKNI